MEPPKNASMMSSKPMNGAPPAPPEVRENGSPPASTTARFCGSMRTSKAALMSCSRSCASGSSLTSGWYLRASFRYAFLSSSSVAFRSTPRMP
jgi:hypothetical protein